MNRDTEDDGALFRAAMKDVLPLKDSGRLRPAARSPAPRPRQREADDAAVLREMMDIPTMDVGEELAYHAPGVQASVYRRLKRGVYRVGDELDLHGLRADEAKRAVARFVADCRARDLRCVRIIHGKGLRSKGDGPVLKQRLDGWLRRHRDVLAFSSARAEHGGTGAVYVLLRG